MKLNRLLAFLAATLALPAFADDFIDVVAAAKDFGLDPTSVVGKQVTMTPVGPLRRTYGTNLIILAPKTLTADTNGVTVFSNSLWGTYDLLVPGKSPTIFRLDWSTNFSGRVSAATLVQNPATKPPNPATNYYTIPQVDALLVPLRYGVATNVYSSQSGSGIEVDTLGFVQTINVAGNLLDWWQLGTNILTNITASTIPNNVLTNGQTGVTLSGSFIGGATIATNLTQYSVITNGSLYYPGQLPNLNGEIIYSLPTDSLNIDKGNVGLHLYLDRANLNTNLFVQGSVSGMHGYFDALTITNGIDGFGLLTGQGFLVGSGTVLGSLVTGSVSGDGSGLSRLDGAQLQIGSVNWDKFDPVTQQHINSLAAATNSAGSNAVPNFGGVATNLVLYNPNSTDGNIVTTNVFIPYTQSVAVAMSGLLSNTALAMSGLLSNTALANVITNQWVGNAISLDATNTKTNTIGGKLIVLGKSVQEGGGTAAGDSYAHAEGVATVASGMYSHAEGNTTTASGVAAHAEGSSTEATGASSFAGGYKSHATNANTFVWSDGTEFGSTASKQVAMHADNGFRFIGGQAVFGDSTGGLLVATNGVGWSNATSGVSWALYPDGHGNLAALAEGTPINWDTNGNLQVNSLLVQNDYVLLPNATNDLYGTLHREIQAGGVTIGTFNSYTQLVDATYLRSNVNLGNWSLTTVSSKLDVNGNGGGLTALNASQLASGTVSDARLSTTYTNGLAGTNYVAAATNALWTATTNRTTAGTNDLWIASTNRVAAATNDLWAATTNRITTSTNDLWAAVTNKGYLTTASNLDGTKISSGSIRSNMVEAATWMLMTNGAAGAGDALLAGTNTWTGTNTYTGKVIFIPSGDPITYAHGLVVTNSVTASNFIGDGSLLAGINANLPEILVRTNGDYVKNGVLVHNPTSTTAGIQEALNVAPVGVSFKNPNGGVGGATIKLDRGVFYTTTTITNPFPVIVGPATNYPPYQLTIEGEGMGASSIVYVGTQTNAVMRLGYQATMNCLLSLEMRRLGIFSTVNGCTNILQVDGNMTNAQFTTMGGIGRGIIDHCWFGYWNSLTNLDGFSPASFVDPNESVMNLIGINCNLEFNDTFTIRDCSFSYLAVGIHFVSDHGVLNNNMFEHGGFETVSSNSWPVTNAASIGPAIWLDNRHGPPYGEDNGHDMWNINGNNMVGWPVCYASTMQVMAGGRLAWPQVVIYNNTSENGTPVADVVTLGNSVTFIDERPRHGDGDGGYFVSYFLTNTANYTTFTNTVAPTNMVTHIDNVLATNSGPYGFGGVVTAAGFVGPINGTNLTSGTVNSNALDTATKAQLALAGTGGGGSGYTNGNMAGTSLTNGNNITVTGTVTTARLVLTGGTGGITLNTNFTATSLTASGNVTGSVFYGSAAGLTGIQTSMSLVTNIWTTNATGTVPGSSINSAVTNATYAVTATNLAGGGSITGTNIAITGTGPGVGLNTNLSLQGSLYLTNMAMPTAVSGGGWLWCSNNVLYWLTTTKTNLISNGN